MEGWRQSSLGHAVAEMRNGINCSQSKNGIGQCISRIETISDGTFDLTRVGYAELTLEQRLKYLLRKGDILFSHINSPVHVGKSAILDDAFEIYHGVNLMLFRAADDVLPQFLQHYLHWIFRSGYWLKVCKQSVNQASVNQTDIKAVPFPHPPMPEQKRIVAILDESFEGIDKAISNTEKNLANARELFDATVQEVFGGAEPNWRTETLQYLLDNNWVVGHLDGNHGSDYPRKEEFVSSGVPYISANCIEGEQVDLDRAKYLSPERAARIRKGVACDGDVLFAHNATVGPVAMLRTSEPRVILGTSLTYYRCNREKIIPEYLAHYMRSTIFRRQYEQVMRQSTRNQVPITKQREFTHVVPPLEVQNSIASRLDGLDDEKRRLEDAYNGKIVRLQELKQAALARAFSGALGSSDVLTEAAE